MLSPSLLCCQPWYLSEPILIMHLFVWSRQNESLLSVHQHPFSYVCSFLFLPCCFAANKCTNNLDCSDCSCVMTCSCDLETCDPLSLLSHVMCKTQRLQPYQAKSCVVRTAQRSDNFERNIVWPEQWSIAEI